MNVINSIMTNNPCYKARRRITVKGLMLHSVGCPQPDPLVFIRNWDRPEYAAACVHGFIGREDVYITLPCEDKPGEAIRGWHCASGNNGSGNNTHLGFEMCEPSNIRYTGGSSFTCSDLDSAREFVKRTTENAIELFARLCKFHNLDPLGDGVIISHAEGAKRGIASNHADPEHLWRGLGTDYTMDTFRTAVKQKMIDMEDENMTGEEIYKKLAEYLESKPVPEWAKSELQEAIDAGITDGMDLTLLTPRYQAAIMAKRAGGLQK